MRLALRVSVALATGLTSEFGFGQTPPRANPIRVLFIGNSYTYVNSLPELVRGLAAGMSPPVAVEAQQITVGGATLRQHWEDGALLAAIRGARWDYVVLQEQRSLGATLVNGQSVISDPNRLFWPFARRFDREIRPRGARTVLLQTWGPTGADQECRCPTGSRAAPFAV